MLFYLALFMNGARCMEQPNFRNKDRALEDSETPHTFEDSAESSPIIAPPAGLKYMMRVADILEMKPSTDKLIDEIVKMNEEVSKKKRRVKKMRKKCPAGDRTASYEAVRAEAKRLKKSVKKDNRDAGKSEPSESVFVKIGGVKVNLAAMKKRHLKTALELRGLETSMLYYEHAEMRMRTELGDCEIAEGEESKDSEDDTGDDGKSGKAAGRKEQKSRNKMKDQNREQFNYTAPNDAQAYFVEGDQVTIMEMHQKGVSLRTINLWLDYASGSQYSDSVRNLNWTRIDS